MKTVLSRLHVGAGTSIGPLTLFPVWSEKATTTKVVLPNDTNFKVSELPSESVPHLLVENCGSEDLLIVEGTILEGGYQTRIAAHDYVVAPGETLQIEVRCVEAGRWGGHAREHQADGRAPWHVLSSLRKTLRPEGYEGRSQNEVWESVRRIEHFFGQKPSSSLNDIFADEGMSRRKPRSNPEESRPRIREDRIVTVEILEELERIASKPLPGQQGVVIGIAGEVVSLELYSTPELFQEQYLAILQAACLDAVFADWSMTPGWKARSFAAKVSDTELDILQKDHTFQTSRGLNEDIDLRVIVPSDELDATLRVSALNRKHLVNA